MKKSLVLAMAMALGVTASAYAANPFSDVPAGHWAYDSLAKLADTGVIDGYPDGTFKGDETITRYEAAQITARAMAKGAQVDKLAAEFASELEALGVKVAALEKNADNVKITGQVRYHYATKSGDLEKVASHKLRTRLFVKGQINDDWGYTGRVQNERVISNGSTADNDTTKLNWAYVSGKLGGVKVDAGRMDVKIHDGNVMDWTPDAIVAKYGKKVQVTGAVVKAAASTNGYTPERTYVFDVAGKLGVVNASATYYKTNGIANQQIIEVAANLPVAKNLKATAEYINGKVKDGDNYDKNGYVVGLAYAGAKAATPGTWGVWANYRNQPAATYIKHTVTGYADLTAGVKDEDGFKGFDLGANYTVAKNIVAAVRYFDLQGRNKDNNKVRTLWSELVFTF